MKEFIEKLIGGLEEEKQRLRRMKNDTIALSDSEVIAIEEGAYNFCKEIAIKLAEEYNNGWIPCEVRLPDYYDNVLVCTKDDGRTIAHLTHFPIEWKDIHNYKIENIIAWQSLPAPYKKGE